jgi:GTP-binding protein Era
VRSGLVALVGRPNVGKSTLLNAYLGTKVSIVSPKPQTTRIAVRGILNRDDTQVVFIDTPGLHRPKSRLGEYMVEAARRAIPDADVVCFVIDASEPPRTEDRRIAAMVKRSGKPSILVLNKVDIARHADVVLQQYRELGPWDTEVAVSAQRAEGLTGLLDEIVARLPEGPRLFPADQYTDLTEREQVGELIREKVLLNTQQEVPHGVAVEVEEWEQRGERLYIRATVNVEREGHRAIIIGEQGQMLKKIGSAARYEIERLLDRGVYLDLWVKVRKDWRSDPSSLRWLGYDVKKLG